MKLYAIGEFKGPLRLVRGHLRPGEPVAGAFAAGLPEVNEVIHARAAIGAAAATAVLASRVSTQERSAHPSIELVKGDRTDWHINMTVDIPDGADIEYAIATGLSIEYGHRDYTDRLGRHVAPTQGVGALSAAMLAMGAGF